MYVKFPYGEALAWCENLILHENLGDDEHQYLNSNVRSEDLQLKILSTPNAWLQILLYTIYTCTYFLDYYFQTYIISWI